MVGGYKNLELVHFEQAFAPEQVKQLGILPIAKH